MKINLTAEQAAELQDLAELPGQSIKDMCTVMQLNVDEFLNDMADTGSDVYKAIQTGRAITRIAFEKKVVQLANQGSGPAQTLVHKLMKQSRVNDLRDFYG